MKKNDPMNDNINFAAALDGRPSGPLSGEAQTELDRVKGILADEGPVPGLPDRLVSMALEAYPRNKVGFDIVLSFLDGVLSVLSSGQDLTLQSPLDAAAVRADGTGTTPFMTVTKAFNRAVVAVHIEGNRKSTCSFTVQATEPGTAGPLLNSRVELVSGWREFASSPLKEGTALFEDVRPGSYELIVRKNDAVLGRMTVKIQG